MGWEEDALCKDCVNPNVFFPDKGDSLKIKIARFICKRCPVKAECLDYALHWRVDGVWAGTTDNERKKIRPLLGIIPKTIPINETWVQSKPVVDSELDLLDALLNYKIPLEEAPGIHISFRT